MPENIPCAYHADVVPNFQSYLGTTLKVIFTGKIAIGDSPAEISCGWNVMFTVKDHLSLPRFARESFLGFEEYLRGCGPRNTNISGLKKLELEGGIIWSVDYMLTGCDHPDFFQLTDVVEPSEPKELPINMDIFAILKIHN